MTKEKMRRTKNILTAELTISVVVTLLLITLFETGMLAPGAYAADDSMCFIVAMVMELVTICIIPLSLYMFKLNPIRRSLTQDYKEKAANSLLLWGSLRIMALCVPMLLNTLFYYIFGIVVSFGYMAIILFLCLFMVYPSMGRCEYEITPNSHKK